MNNQIFTPEKVMVSALQHYVYCPRQCALIHVDNVWQENIFTLRGKYSHERVDVPDGMIRDGVRIERALPIWSDRIGLVGKADVVEFQLDGTPYPVEHKVGPRKYRRADEVQLCAQALCLEEMLEVLVPEGALYYHKSKKRRRVFFDEELRAQVRQVASEVRRLIELCELPPPILDSRCNKCSLLEICLPNAGKLVREDSIND